MFLSIFFTTIVLTGNHLYPILASPLVAKDDFQSLNYPHILAKPKRASTFIPADFACNTRSQWRARQCKGGADDTVWVDTCAFPSGKNTYTREGVCPDNTMCMNKYSILSALMVRCVERPQSKTGAPVTGGTQVTADGQVGVYPVSTFFSEEPEQLNVSVAITKTISTASVTAYLEGTYQSSQLTFAWQLSYSSS